MAEWEHGMHPSQISYRASWDEPFADIPCSYLWRAWYAQEFERIILPRIDTPEDDALRHEVLPVVSPLPGHYEQMRARVAHLEKQVWKLQSLKRKSSKYD